MKLKQLITIPMLVVMLAAVGCGGGKTRATTPIDVGDSLNWNKEAKLVTAQSCEEARELLVKASITGMRMQLEQTRRNWNGWGGGGDVMMAESSDGGDSNASAAPADGDSKEYSGTNTQVDGVDEADLVKTDGDHIYTLAGSDLVIVQAWPANEAKELGRVSIGAQPYAMYLYGDKVVTLSYGSVYDFLSDAQKASYQNGDSYSNWYWQGATLVTVVDIADKAAPAVQKAELFEGYLLSSRRIGSRMYLVQQTWPSWNDVDYWPNLDYDASGSELDAAIDGLIQKNTNAIRERELGDWLPQSWDVTQGALSEGGGEVVTACDAVHVPNVFSGEGMVTTVTVDLDGENDAEASSVSGNWGNVYASTDALYVAATNWSYWWWWGDGNQPEVTTHVHKFAFGDGGRAQYAASGKVKGYTINQFAMDEHEQRLRIATTDGFSWWWGDGESESLVTVFEETGGKLKTVGQVGGLGKGEQIYSVRFVGDQGYVVTFRQVDPLYVLDLSNPTKPAVRGELKIPGFSSYIHPLGDGHLLTIGRDGTEDGQVLGLSFQIFDVSDPTDPKQVQKTTLGDGWSSWSEAQWDHHAFTYFAKKQMLALPVETWDGGSNGYYGSWSTNLQLFNVSVEDGISLAGSISHDNLIDTPKTPNDCGYWNYSWRTRVRRGVFIEDFIYSVSGAGIMVHDLESLTEGAVASLPLLDTEEINVPEWCYYEDMED